MTYEQYSASVASPYAISCGGAVYREVEGMREYALLFRGERFGKYGNSWHLPKGTLHKHETLEDCAAREIREESGLTVEIGSYIGGLLRRVELRQENFPIDKMVHYFLCAYISGDGSQMDHEHDALEWFSAAEAIERLVQIPKREDHIIQRAEDYFAKFTAS